MVNYGNYVAYIPVRGGSKSIPLKNIKELNGRPLVFWVIDAALGCEAIDKIVIHTDSEKIKQTVLSNESYAQNSRIVCLDRKQESATDTASTESAMLEFADQFSFGNIILIQATSPLLTSEDLNSAVRKYEDKKSDSLLSVVRQKRFIWEERSTGAYPVNYDYNKRPRRQEFDGFFVENGAFYITSRESLLKSKCRLSGKIDVFEMSEESYFEIDEPGDWIIIEELAKRKTPQKNSQKIKLFVMDCDGVLTDNGMYYSSTGEELKKFSTLDGMGVQLLRENGIKTAIITSEDINVVKKRAEKIKIDEVFLGCKNKLDVLKHLLEKENLSFDQVAYIGDDINDVDCIKKCGIGFSVPNATEKAKQAADVITTRKGGDGAVREAIELILSGD